MLYFHGKYVSIDYVVVVSIKSLRMKISLSKFSTVIHMSYLNIHKGGFMLLHTREKIETDTLFSACSILE